MIINVRPPSPSPPPLNSTPPFRPLSTSCAPHKCSRVHQAHTTATVTTTTSTNKDKHFCQRPTYPFTPLSYLQAKKKKEWYKFPITFSNTVDKAFSNSTQQHRSQINPVSHTTSPLCNRMDNVSTSKNRSKRTTSPIMTCTPRT